MLTRHRSNKQEEHISQLPTVSLSFVRMVNVYFVTFLVGLIISAIVLIIHKQTNTIAVLGLSKQANRQSTFIIAGPSYSGKTTLFNYLTSGKITSTVTSQEPNETSKYKLPSAGDHQSNFRLVEFPGHNKLRNLLYEEIKSSTSVKGILFLLDSSIDPKNLNLIAGFLYEVLKISESRPGGIDVLVGCNKSDLFSSRQSFKIREILELEIDTIRKLNSKNISKVDNNDGVDTKIDDDEFGDLGQSINQAFKFENLEANVDFISGSVLKQKIDKWECWIDERSVN